MVAISESNNFIPLLNGFIADVLKFKAFLKVKIECVYVIMYSLVMIFFSCNLLKNRNRLIKVSTVLNLVSDYLDVHATPGFQIVQHQYHIG